MNASVSTFPREVEIQSKIRRIRTVGRGARVVSSALFSVSFVGGVLVMLAVTLAMLFGPTREQGNANGGLEDIMRSALTPLQFNVWAFLLLSGVLGIWLGILRQLERLFGNLAAGEIYTSENVHRLRTIGILCLAWASLDIMIPATHVAALSMIGAALPMDLGRFFPSMSALLSSFIAPALVLFISWVMDIGLYEKEHADALERDAELVI
jgi:hypothetical protein